MTERWQLPGGCLSDRALQALGSGAVVPSDVVRHLATCGSCQRRALEIDAPRRPGGPARRPSLKRTLFYVGVFLLVTFAALFSMLRMR